MERTLTKREFLREWGGDVWRDGQLFVGLGYEDLAPGDEITLDSVDEPGFYLIDYIDSKSAELTKIL